MRKRKDAPDRGSTAWAVLIQTEVASPGFLREIGVKRVNATPPVDGKYAFLIDVDPPEGYKGLIRLSLNMAMNGVDVEFGKIDGDKFKVTHSLENVPGANLTEELRVAVLFP